MARDRRPVRNSPAGPGRKPRSRAGWRTSSAQSADDLESATTSRLPIRLPKLRNHLGLTRRALVFISLLVVLALSYANSLRIYLDQQNDLAVAQQQIRNRSQRIFELEDELRRWDDPAFLKAQARERLGWVLPGETGFRVIGPDGKPIGGGVVIQAESELPPGEYPEMWFDRMWGSIQTADQPVRRIGS